MRGWLIWIGFGVGVSLCHAVLFGAGPDLSSYAAGGLVVICSVVAEEAWT